MKKCLFLCPYPINQAPSQRFRFEQYFTALKEKSIFYETQPFLSQKAWDILYSDGKPFLKATFIMLGFIKRLFLLLSIHKYDIIFIHREASPLGPPFFEWAIAKLWQKKIIYDFDDAIWLEDPSEKGSLLAKLKWKSKVAEICRWAHKISCGNEYLCAYAKQFNDHVVLNPTTIDTDQMHNPRLYQKQDKQQIVIGWTGTHSTLKYLDGLVPIIKSLEAKYPICFLVIANKKPEMDIKCLQFIKWSKASEVKDLMNIDIGVMPLTNDIWSQGKCGFKLLQYMALGIPAVASPVGVNQSIIQDGQDGYLCQSEGEWESAIEKLIMDEAIRRRFGNEGRSKVIKGYSLASNTERFVSLFDDK